jgi:hypothetical protein
MGDCAAAVPTAAPGALVDDLVTRAAPAGVNACAAGAQRRPAPTSSAVDARRRLRRELARSSAAWRKRRGSLCGEIPWRCRIAVSFTDPDVLSLGTRVPARLSTSTWEALRTFTLTRAGAVA